MFGYKQIDENRDVPLCRHDGLLARQSTRNLDSALATLRHCHLKYELFSLEEVVKSPISSRNTVFIDKKDVCQELQ